MNALNSRLYQGWVRHRRYLPKPHACRYPVFMSWLDLNEIDRVIEKSRFWSRERLNLVSFVRGDYLGEQDQDLRAAVTERIKQQTGESFDGRICLLTHLRYLGFCFNPVSFYFCYPTDSEQPRFILAEINNTPWNERYCYLLDTEKSPHHPASWSFEFDKVFHVSPFMPMALRYQWRFSLKGENLLIHMTLLQEGERCFDATLLMQARQMNGRTMRTVPLKYPFLTLKVVFLIYWHALLLRLKGLPVYDHPDNPIH